MSEVTVATFLGFPCLKKVTENEKQDSYKGLLQVIQQVDRKNIAQWHQH